MFARFKSWFAAPIFADDDDKTRLANLLNIVLTTATLVVILLILGSLIGGNIRPVAIALIGAFGVITLGPRWLMYNGGVKPASFLLVLLLSLLSAGVLAIGGTIRGPGLIYLVLANIMAGLLISRRAALVSAGLNCLLVFGLIAAENSGWLPPPILSVTVSQGVAFAVGALMTVVLVNQATRGIDEALTRARRELAERQRTDARLQHSAEEMFLLYKMGVALTSGQNLYHALRAFVKELRRLMIVDAFHVVMYDEQTDMLSYPLFLNLEADLSLPARKLSVNPGLTGEVISTRRTLYLPDVTQPETQQAHQIVVIVDAGIHSYVGIPLLTDNRIIGVLSVQALQTNAYSVEQVRLLETLATQVAITVEKSRLLEQLQQELAERKRAEIEVQKSEERYRAAITAAGLVPYVIDYRLSRFTFIGEGIINLTGHSAETFTPTMMKAGIQEEYIWGPNADMAPDEARHRFLTGAIPEWRSDMCIRTQAGENRWISDASIALLDEQGKVQGAIGILQDITERKLVEEQIRQLNTELEAHVAQRTAQLEGANRELEAFSYSVSHDLRAPLRGIDGFSRLLLERHAGQLDESGQHHLRRVRENAQRMGDLIDDLLEFSRLSRLPLSKQRVDPAGIARDALGELQLTFQSRRIHLTIAELPACHADPSLLRQVFVNLLGNAIKYTAAREVAEIQVSAQQGENSAVYFVRDNGVGFDMRYADKLFGVFQRLHSVDEFEGTGVGLAIVKRIVERHGGRIWAEAEVDKGSVFYFTLEPPQAQTSAPIG